jgi:outer membrane protein TolC
VSNARIEWLKARDLEQDKSRLLAVLIGSSFQEFKVDTSFLSVVPGIVQEIGLEIKETHPVLQFQQSQIAKGEEEVNHFRRLSYPTVSLFGILQGRGSGFKYNYPQDQTAYSGSYIDGASIGRGNYLAGIGLTWNLSSFSRNNPKIKSQELVVKGLQEEYNLAVQELEAQSKYADKRFGNSWSTYLEAPKQVKAAADAYNQNLAFYRNGLTTIEKLTQTLYTLNRSETEYEIASNNVWQALLLKAAATGDLDYFLQQIK